MLLKICYDEMETVSCKLGPTVQAQSMLSFPISAVREGDATASTGHYSGSATIVAVPPAL